MRDRETCVACGKLSPETDTNYTLISAQFGWRLVRQFLPDGALLVEWRCPKCWADFKRARSANGASVPPSSASPARSSPEPARAVPSSRPSPIPPSATRSASKPPAELRPSQRPRRPGGAR